MPFGIAARRIFDGILRQFGLSAQPRDFAGCAEIAAGVVNSGGFE
jgi:hypothetical protein